MSVDAGEEGPARWAAGHWATGQEVEICVKVRHVHCMMPSVADADSLVKVAAIGRPQRYLDGKIKEGLVLSALSLHGVELHNVSRFPDNEDFRLT